MRIRHGAGFSLIQGTVKEEARILKWIEEAQKINPSIEIVVDECDEDETSFTVYSRNETQQERHETFQLAKKRMKGLCNG